jgi:serine/threonine-protein kinase
MGLVLLTFVMGYAASALWISPAPVFTSEHALPRVLALPEPEARSNLARLGFRARIDGERPSATVPRGAVLWQDPPPAVVLSPNSVVQLVLSAGPAPATVPDVIGFAVPSAERVLEAAGVKLGAVDTVRGGREPGIVLATRPAPGTGRPRGSAVDLVVSGGQGGGL